MKNNELRLGVVGYCPPSKFDESKALEYIIDGYNKIQQDFPYKNITVVSGLTNVGVIKIAYEEAKRRNWKTAGVACKKAYDYKESWFAVDESPVIVGEKWGDESSTFTNSIDTILKIGGGPQSIREFEEIRKEGKPVYQYDLPKIE